MRWLFPLLTFGCSPVGAPEALVTPDPARDGLDGADGPFGAAAVSLAVQARVTEVVPTTVVFPADDALAPSVQGAPAIVFVHGGFAAPERYLWLARHFATRGYVSILPESELLLAIAQPGNGAIALEALRDSDDPLLAGLVPADGPTAAMGHSLGGVLAAQQWVDDPTIDLLAELASFPAAGAAVEEQADRPVLSIVGTTDNGLDAVVDSMERFPGPASLHVVDGMNHYAWTDDASDGELARDGAQGRPLDELRRDAQRVIDAFLDVYLTGADDSLLDGPFPGTVAP